jgi:hypothetical protein
VVLILLGLAAGVGWMLAVTLGRAAWKPAPPVTRVDLFVGWTLVSLGAIHAIATPLFYHEFSGAALWFASGGIAIALTGALNVLRVMYAGVAPAVARACIAANLATGALALAFVVRAGSTILHRPQYAMFFGLVAAATAFSLRRAPAGGAGA